MFTGDAGSGESNVRRWIIENDLLEAMVALPDQLFYNTGISTYFWIVTNRKRPERQGKVQLIDASSMSQKMRKSLGNKRQRVQRRAHRRGHAHLRYFYVYVPPRPLAEIEADIRELETEIVRMLGEITGNGAEQAP